MPARKEILKNCRQVIFHVFKHDLDEVGHFCKNRRSLKCFIEGMRTCLGLKRLLKYPREHTLSNKRSVNSIEKLERKLPWKWGQVVFRCLGNKVPFSPKIMIACHFGLPYFYYLLFLNEKKIFIQVFWKKMWKETSDQHLLGQFLYSGTQRSGITNSDEVYFTKKQKQHPRFYSPSVQGEG